MHPNAQRIWDSRWRWTALGILGSAGSTILVPLNLYAVSAFEEWILWLVFPFGMAMRHAGLPAPLQVAVWYGPPTVYGIILSLTAKLPRWRWVWYGLAGFHVLGVVNAALR